MCLKIQEIIVNIFYLIFSIYYYKIAKSHQRFNQMIIKSMLNIVFPSIIKY